MALVNDDQLRRVFFQQQLDARTQGLDADDLQRLGIIGVDVVTLHHTEIMLGAQPADRLIEQPQAIDNKVGSRPFTVSIEHDRFGDLSFAGSGGAHQKLDEVPLPNTLAQQGDLFRLIVTKLHGHPPDKAFR
ncbi:MAG: hypothetical protein WCY71_10800 [Halothiobacillaceae bacterium]